MMEQDRRDTTGVATHIDRCLSCLGCMTACPSGVDYMHLIDEARARVEQTAARPWPERMLRTALAAILPRPSLFRLALRFAGAMRRAADRLPGRLGALVRSAPPPSPPDNVSGQPSIFPAAGERRLRVALLRGCVQPVLRPAIDTAVVRLLNRHGAEVVTVRGSGCCGAIPYHLGRPASVRRWAQANIRAWEREIDDGGLDAIVVAASGCGTMIKAYGALFVDQPAWAARAARIADLCRNVSEVIAVLGLSGVRGGVAIPVAYQSPCSMQHGQKLDAQPRDLLTKAGFDLRVAQDDHLCCGSAGTYSLLQPNLAEQLGTAKSAALEASGAAIVATGNIGCLVQISGKCRLPIVHTAELLDWATGGPRPQGLGSVSGRALEDVTRDLRERRS
jgi:glycolate oxidase iron-sulfur subunit